MVRVCNRSWELFAALAILFTGTDAQLSPSEGLCQRWGHQSALIGEKVYLMGGMRLVQDPTTGAVREESTNEFMTLDVGPQGSEFHLENTGEVQELPPKWEAVQFTVNGAPGLPDVTNGAMFANGEDLYIYEGRLPGSSLEASSSLWKYTKETSVWSQHLTWAHPDSNVPYRVSRGGSVTNGDRGIGVYVGGARIWINDTGTPENGRWYYPSEEQFTTFDLRTLNRTTSSLPDSQKRMGAALAYLPIGKEGAIIGIGGTLENDEIRESGNIANIKAENFDPDDLNYSPMQRVWILDIATRKWHSQATFGSYFPDVRMEHCIAVASAPDNSSHNIYMFGGSSGSSLFNRESETYFNDLYILSLPSFRWIRKSFEVVDKVPVGRVQHTCHTYGTNLLIFGGATQNNATNNCTWDEINILDMATLRWVTDYHYSSDAYTVPDIIMGSISNNGEVQTAPVNGWDDHEIEEMFAYATAGGNTGGKSSMSKIAVIAGAVAGGVVLLLAVAAGVFFLRRRKRDNRKKNQRLTATGFEASRIDSKYQAKRHESYQAARHASYQPSINDPGSDGSAVELYSPPIRYGSRDINYGSGFAHPGKLWRESYHSYELSEADLDPMDRDDRDDGDDHGDDHEDDSARLIGKQGKASGGYFELGDPASPIVQRYELDGESDLSTMLPEEDDIQSPERGRGRWR